MRTSISIIIKKTIRKKDITKKDNTKKIKTDKGVQKIFLVIKSKIEREN